MDMRREGTRRGEDLREHLWRAARADNRDEFNRVLGLLRVRAFELKEELKRPATGGERRTKMERWSTCSWGTDPRESMGNASSEGEVL